MPITWEDNTVRVTEEMNVVIAAWLEEVAGEFESRTKRNTPVDTGQLKNSWEHHVDTDKGEAVIGSPLENAIWNEFGTGQYAVNGDGRKKPWAYQDWKGNWHRTSGKRPQRSLFNAYESLKDKVQKSLENKLKGLGK